MKFGDQRGLTFLPMPSFSLFCSRFLFLCFASRLAFRVIRGGSARMFSTLIVFQSGQRGCTCWWINADTTQSFRRQDLSQSTVELTMATTTMKATSPQRPIKGNVSGHKAADQGQSIAP